MKFIVRGDTIRQSERAFVPSFLRPQVFDGARSCADPSGILRGKLYEIWIRPLRLSITFGALRLLSFPSAFIPNL
jgi:hypothetical protein